MAKGFTRESFGAMDTRSNLSTCFWALELRGVRYGATDLRSDLNLHPARRSGFQLPHCGNAGVGQRPLRAGSGLDRTMRGTSALGRSRSFTRNCRRSGKSAEPTYPGSECCAVDERQLQRADAQHPDMTRRAATGRSRPFPADGRSAERSARRTLVRPTADGRSFSLDGSCL